MFNEMLAMSNNGGSLDINFESETAAANTNVNKVIKNGYYVGKFQNEQTIVGCGHIIDGVFTSDFLSGTGIASYDASTNTLTVSCAYTTAIFYFFIVD